LLCRASGENCGEEVVHAFDGGALTKWLDFKVSLNKGCLKIVLKRWKKGCSCVRACVCVREREGEGACSAGACL